MWLLDHGERVGTGKGTFMKAYKVELLIIDVDEVGDRIKYFIEHANYPNDCIQPHVMWMEYQEIGTWSDDYPLNKRVTLQEEYQRLFEKSLP